MLDPSLDTPERMYTDPRVLGAGRARLSRRRHPAGVGHRARPRRTATTSSRHCSPAPRRSTTSNARSIKRFNATLVTYLFLLYFDTRAGYCDTGPYAVPGHPNRKLLVRDFYRLAQSDFWWSDVAKDVPYQNLTAAFVLEDVEFTVTDFGTSNHEPDRLPRPPRRLRALHDRRLRAGELRPVPLWTRSTTIVTAVRSAQAQHYRRIAAMERDEKIRCGAYVYFSFLRPFAQEAGIDRRPRLVRSPRPSGLAYQLLSAIEGDNAAAMDEGDYYGPIP